MMLRATQTYTSVLGSDVGSLRASQTYVSVLYRTGYECETISVCELSCEATPSKTGLHVVAAESQLLLSSESEIIMALRVTQTYVSALAADTGKLRATGTYVSVLYTDAGGGSEYDVSATSTLSLTQTATSGVIDAAAQSILTLTSDASAPHTYYKAATSPITLTSASTSASTGEPPLEGDGVSVLTLSDSALSGHRVGIASSVITLSDLFHLGQEYAKSAAVSLSLTQAASHLPTGRVDAESTLVISQDADNNVKVRSPSSSLSLTSTATADQIKTASNTLSLSQQAVQGILSFNISDTIALTSTAKNAFFRLFTETQSLSLSNAARSSILMLPVSDTINVSDSLVVIRPWYVNIEDALSSVELVYDLDTDSLIEVVTGLDHAATATVIGPRSASNIISFAQVAIGSHVRADGTDVSAESTLSLSVEAINSLTGDATSTLSLTQVVAGVTARPAENSLSSLGVAASVVVIRGIAASNAIILKQATAFVLERDDTLCTYSPFIGDSSDPDAPTPPPATYTAAQGTPGFRLQYPATGSVTDELILRAPNLGNLDRLSATRINRETRGGTLIIYADPIWPKVETLVLSFSGLSNAEAQALLTFMEEHIGEDVKLIDWEDRLWTGVISNIQEPIVQDRRSNCSFTASFEFEGTKV